MVWKCNCVCCIVPPHMLKKLLESGDDALRQSALNSLILTERMRGQRGVRAGFVGAVAPADGRRTIYDCKTSSRLADAVLVRSEDGKASADASVNRAFDGFGATRDFYSQVLKRNSLDDRGKRLDGYVHRGKKFNNAFWDGQEMVFGDGDGVIFTDFTASIDVIAHELTHGVTEFAAGLEYHNQSGALNESISDVFGSLVKQWKLKQTAQQADWLIGADVLVGQPGEALRSLKNPGRAYANHPVLGDDPQPAHMNNYMQLADDEDNDWGGVHINSGIPNHAFFLTAMSIGGNAWDAPGQIWYAALRASSANTDFPEFAGSTYAAAGQLYGEKSVQQKAVADAWAQVGLPITPVKASALSPEAEALVLLNQTIKQLSDRVDDLSKKVESAQHR